MVWSCLLRAVYLRTGERARSVLVLPWRLCFLEESLDGDGLRRFSDEIESARRRPTTGASGR